MATMVAVKNSISSYQSMAYVIKTTMRGTKVIGF